MSKKPKTPDNAKDPLPRQYVTIFKRLAKLTAAASKTEGALIQNLLLTHSKGRTRLLATDGHCAVAVSHASESLLDTGERLIIPADLAQGIAKAKGRKDDLVEIVDGSHKGQPVVEACLPSGISLQMASPPGENFPDVEKLITPPKAAFVVEITAATLRTALKAILSACPAVNTIQIRAVRDKPLLWITGDDGEATFTAVLAGAKIKLVETDDPKPDEAKK